MRPLLALDLSLTSTGVAWRTADGTIDTRVIRTEPGDAGRRTRRDGGVVWSGSEYRRMAALACEVHQRVDLLHWDGQPLVYAESVPTRGARNIALLGMLHGHVQHALGFRPVYIDPLTVKKHITGHGDASKREVDTAVRIRFSPEFFPRDVTLTEDEIDALAVLAWAIDQEDTDP